MTSAPQILRWGHHALEVEIGVGEDGTARLTYVGLPGGTPPERHSRSALPLVEVTAAGHGRYWSGSRLIHTSLGGRLRYRAHQATRDADWHVLTVELHDPETGLVAEVSYRSPDGIAVLRGEVTLRNEGQTALHLESVSSLAVGGLTPQDPAAIDAADLLWAENDWLTECRWQRQPMRLTTPVHSGRVSNGHGKAGFALNGQGTWSSCGHLPMGGLTDRRTGRTWVWQIEHNGGGWRWECEEQDKAAYAALFGPTDSHHGWRHSLEPGAVFRTVPAALAFSDGGGPDEAFAALTRYRRAHRRPHGDHQRLPVIFNDYMNCLMGDPTTEKLLPHIDAAADAGAEYFVIDAGWYDGENGGWWDSVGVWEPASSRFPGERGIHEVLDRIRERGMVPGLWLEPEVIGVRSPMAESLPDEAFFRRDGIRVTETGRHHLDLRHPAARAHLDQVVDRLVGEWGVGYLKLDHNIDPGSGTSAHPGETPAAGLLGHNRAQLDWLDGVLDRYPHLVLENCSSGGMRWDHALLSRMQLQSTSDQQNLQLYAPIAASAPAAVTPEQGAVWAYPEPEDSLDEVAFTMANALLGRIHLSGRIPELEPEARALVHEAVAVYKAIRADLPQAVPSWPLGLPGWDAPWIALALRTPAATYLTVWRRPGADATATLHLPHLRDIAAGVDLLYPSASRAVSAWTPDTAELSLTLPTAPSAVLLRITPTDADAS
ncbi:glycoside hydrolase family 36 protein [Streptomyces sp. NBC_00576]|uniref:glycoside hydrolase family 36 protein n=1 Tax=Streptomyces sp. NBC_00576 TaxID=2903665 RepID=UPI002E80D158|nr:glycoside hydrolase family 36 protein [Streptomyces sp. NBC_00576]WUB76194.1 alpha-galactosidase [Streptomyces sp. NBC_00576]